MCIFSLFYVYANCGFTCMRVHVRLRVCMCIVNAHDLSFSLLWLPPNGGQAT